MSVTAVLVLRNRRYLRVVLRLGNFLEHPTRGGPRRVPFFFFYFYPFLTTAACPRCTVGKLRRVGRSS